MSLRDLTVGLHCPAGVRPRKLWYHTAEHEYVVPGRVIARYLPYARSNFDVDLARATTG